MNIIEPCEPSVVLIVDDLPDNLALLSDALEQVGHMVLVALDGTTALERMNRLKPDIVLLDAMMPGIDGFETCRRIKANAEFEDVPVVFMTALTESEHVVEGFAAGGVDYVTKPIVPEQVLARVASHLRTARSLRDARLAAQQPPARDAGAVREALARRYQLTARDVEVLETV
nr:response regulator [Pseudomonas sp.]